MNANNEIKDESTAVTSGNRSINSDHIRFDTITTEASIPPQDQHNEDASGFSTIPALPPLTLINAPAGDREKRKGNSMSFKANNTIRKDSIQAKRQRQGYTSEEFREKMTVYLRDKSTQCCFSQRHNKFTKCTCLKDFMHNNDANISIVADIVTSYHGLVYKERQSLLSNKIYNVMDQKLTSKLHNIKSIKFRGKLFSLRGKFNDAVNNDQTLTHPICLCGFLSVYGIGYYKFDTIKGKFDQSTFDTEWNLHHGLAQSKAR